MFVQEGRKIDYLNPGPIPIQYDSVVNLQTRIAIAAERIAVGATGSLYVAGVFELPAVANAAFAVGDTLYWDPVAGVLTAVAVGNIPAGWATEPKQLAAATARVRLCDNSYVQQPFVLPQAMFIPGQRFTVTFRDIAAADVAKIFWIAPAACKLVSAQERHETAANAVCTLQVEKLADTEAPGAGKELLATGFDISSATDTVVEDLAVATGDEDIAKGEALALRVNNPDDPTGYATGIITLVLEWQ